MHRLQVYSILLVALTQTFAEEPAEKDRDRKVLEAVIGDAMDPKSPLNVDYAEAHGKPVRGILIDVRTFELKYGRRHLTNLARLENLGVIPKGHEADLRLRNKEGPFLLEDLGIAVKGATFVDIDKMFEEAEGKHLFSEMFFERYPDSWGYLQPYLPGYSVDGQSATVVVSRGPSIHGCAEVYYLVLTNGVWEVKGRWRDAF